jgi:5'-3' exonuclease
MDKILLIDGLNFLFRATVNFSYKNQKHELCLELPCNHRLREKGVQHCTCGQEWIIEDSRCYSQANENYVIIYNFFRNLRALIEQFSPDKCFFVLEGYPQFRYDLYAAYKANRIIKTASKQEEMAKFHSAKNEIIRLLQYLPITIARASEYECDDVIATLCENLSEEEVIIVSNDSDYLQVLQKGYKNCKIFNSIKKEYMSAPEYPYVAWKCLNGDKSDNIPALLKPKKALQTAQSPELFAKFLSVEENRANFSINRQLIEFRSVPVDQIEIVEGVRDFSQLKKEFFNMKFNSIIEEKSWIKYCNTFECLKF